jgi:hypothetical protein
MSLKFDINGVEIIAKIEYYFSLLIVKIKSKIVEIFIEKFVLVSN